MTTFFRQYGAPMLLVLVASVQLVVANTTLLSPWKGGGFGMFSTVDSPSARFLRIILDTPSGSVRVSMPDDLRDEAMNLRTLPRLDVINEIARDLASRRWTPVVRTTPEQAYLAVAAPAALSRATTEYSGVRAFAPDEPIAGPLIPVNGVRVELWRYRFERDRGLLSAERLLHAEVRRR